MSLGFLWCSGSVEDKATVFVDIIKANRNLYQISIDDPNLKNAILSLL